MSGSLRRPLRIPACAWILAVAGVVALVPAARADGAPKTLRFPASDTLTVTADLYEPVGDARAAPFVLLLHQAGSSRGEYRAIAPKLAARGLTCLAVDLRSGKSWGEVDNETFTRAIAKGMKTTRDEALKDVDGVLAWRAAREYTGPLVVWGSSYSASLAFFIAHRHEDVRAIVAFSPGDYIAPESSTLREAKRIASPAVFITGPMKERRALQEIFDAIPARRKKLFVQTDGVHGASTLDRSPAAAETWKQVWAFLEAAGLAQP